MNQIEQLNISWKRVDPDNLPDFEVLMKNSADGIIIGVIEECQCELVGYYNFPLNKIQKSNWALRNPIYYIPVTELLNLPKQ